MIRGIRWEVVYICIDWQRIRSNERARWSCYDRVMRLDDTQIAEFDERGYLFFPGLLDTEEAQVLQSEMPALLARRGPEVMPEKGEDSAARLVFGAHGRSEAFHRLALLPRMLLPVRQLLRDQVYLHQSRINPKEGFGKGGQWDWH